MKTYSNIAGTLSDSFRIGKGGVDIIQGETTPVGDIAPLGSLYIKKQDEDVSVYQHVSVGVWAKLGHKPNSYRRNFASADVSDGVLTVNHNLGEKFVSFVIYNSMGTFMPTFDAVSVAVDENTLTVDVSNYGMISGTWAIFVKA